jgi:putative DNA methylase
MSEDDRRLIEEYLPVRAISYEATREKLLRKRDYHLSMLHLWWARRPLAAARAAVYATMVRPDSNPRDAEGLDDKMAALCRWASPQDGGRYGISQLAVETARREILDANGGNPPRILDCFAGGGAIPLEVGRLGGQAYAFELNPVAYLIELCVLVYPQTYGPSLAEDVAKWGQWILERARDDIGDLYPAIGASHEQLALDGTTTQVNATGVPVAYVWTRTVPCPNPALEPHDLDLVRQTWLVKKPGRSGKGKFLALKPVVDRKRLVVRYEVVSAATEDGLGFDPGLGSERGNASCRICGAAVSADDVKRIGKQGQLGRRLIAIATVTTGRRGKAYLGSEDAMVYVPDGTELARRLELCVKNSGLTVPDTPVAAADNQHFQAPMYGMSTVGSLFTDRQQLALLTFCHLVREAHAEMLHGGMDGDRARAVATYLAMAVDRVADRGSSLCHWHSGRETTENTYTRQALPMVWDFPETNPFGPSSGNLASAVEHVSKVIRHCAEAGKPAVVVRGSATDPVDGGPFDAVITDPPYYDNISYADLSDFFYAWLQRSIGHLYPEHLSGPLTPKRREAVAVPYRHGGSDEEARRAYDDMMAESFAHRRDELKPGAPLVVVYAHKTYAGWATLINALRRSGFVVTEAWPLDTEMPTRSVGRGTASLASSIFLVARRREKGGSGDWATEVYPQLRRIVAERVKDLPGRGISGDDLVIAAIGAGLRAYTAYDKVEMPNGEELPPERYLEEVQREVIETVLADVFGLARSGIQAVDPATQFYVMGRFEFGDTYAEFDKANTLGRGVGVELTGSRSLLRGRTALLQQEKGKVKFRDFEQRGAVEGLGEPDEDDPSPRPLIDVLHRLLWLSQHHTADVRDFLHRSQVDATRLQTVAQALSGEALAKKGFGTSSREQAAIAGVLGSWERLVVDNLLRAEDDLFGGAS